MTAHNKLQCSPGDICHTCVSDHNDLPTLRSQLTRRTIGRAPLPSAQRTMYCRRLGQTIELNMSPTSQRITPM